MNQLHILSDEIAKYLTDEWMYGVVKEFNEEAKVYKWDTKAAAVVEKALENYDHTVSIRSREDAYMFTIKDRLKGDNMFERLPNVQRLIAAFHLYWALVHPGETKEQIKERRDNYRIALSYAKS